MKKYLPAVLAGMIGAVVITSVPAWALKVWVAPERPTIAQLNSNFAEVANNNLTNANIASGAAIAHSKLATPALVPKAWAMVSANCTGSAAAGTACTVGDSSLVSSITTNGAAGQFRLNLGYTPADTSFAVDVTTRTSTSVCMADTYATAAPHALIKCFDYTGAALDINQFVVVVMDT